MNDDQKRRIIKISRKYIYEDIDTYTYKYAEASSIPEPQQRDAISSDSHERPDGHMLARNVEYREAQVRTLLKRFIESENQVIIADDELRQNPYIIFKLIVPDELKDEMLKSVATYIHNYLVFGALFDWYGKGMGSKQAAAYAAELEDIETNITNIMVCETVIIPPLNPWGRPISNKY